MKRNPLALIISIVTAAVMAACGDFHTSDNGTLDGFWQLASVDTLATGRSTDVRDRMIFWAVQADLLEVRQLTVDRAVHVFFRFDHHGNELTLSQPVADVRTLSDSVVTDVRTLYPYGLSHLEETLQVLELTGRRMTLQSERLRMYFRKY